MDQIGRKILTISGVIVALALIVWIGSYIQIRRNAVTDKSMPNIFVVNVENEFQRFLYRPLAWSESTPLRRNVVVNNFDLEKVIRSKIF